MPRFNQLDYLFWNTSACVINDITEITYLLDIMMRYIVCSLRLEQRAVLSVSFGNLNSRRGERNEWRKQGTFMVGVYWILDKFLHDKSLRGYHICYGDLNQAFISNPTKTLSNLWKQLNHLKWKLGSKLSFC